MYYYKLLKKVTSEFLTFQPNTDEVLKFQLTFFISAFI